MGYAAYLLTLFGIYGAVAVSLVVVVGDLGLLTVAQGAVFGSGAYAMAGAGRSGHSSFIALLAAAAAGAALMSVLAVLAGRLSRDRFIFATVALQIGFSSLVQNLTNVTGGARGMAAPPLNLFGYQVGAGLGMAFVSIALLALAVVAITLLRRGRFGDALHCIRDAELLARSIGLRPFRYRLVPMAVSGAVTGAAGGLLAAALMFIDPTPFSLTESCLFLAMVALGGGRSVILAVCGAVLVLGIPEVLRFSGISGNVMGNLRQIAGAAILTISAVLLLRERRTTGVALR